MAENRTAEERITEKVCTPEENAAARLSQGRDEAPVKEKCPACARHTERADEDKKKMIVRLKKIEGQIRGIEKMVENDAYCPDILIQVSAATCALNSFNKVLLSNHIHGCVKRDILNGDDASIDELCKVLEKVLR